MSNRFSQLRAVAVFSTLASVLLVSGCEILTKDYTAIKKTGDKKSSVAVQAYNVDDYYQVEHEGRTYIFDDKKTYLSFLATGETVFRLTRIGAGKNGETIVFGLTKKDKKKTSGIGSVMMYDNLVEGASEGFYAELYLEGRIYVFDNWSDVRAFRTVGEAPYRLTDIGAGPNGKTVVYVLNKSNKKVRPDTLIKRFKAVHSK